MVKVKVKMKKEVTKLLSKLETNLDSNLNHWSPLTCLVEEQDTKPVSKKQKMNNTTMIEIGKELKNPTQKITRIMVENKLVPTGKIYLLLEPSLTNCMNFQTVT